MTDTRFVQKAYDALWQAKLNDSQWMKNDGKGRVEFCAGFIKEHKINSHDSVILDIGCGRGTLGHFLDQGASIYGIDISETAIAEATKIYHRADCVDLNTQDLPYADDFFNLTVSLDVIEHVFDPVHLFQEIFRVLKPGGECIISTPNILEENLIKKFLASRRFPKTSGDVEPYDGGHIHFFTYQDIFDLMQKTGFTYQPITPCSDSEHFETKEPMVWVLAHKPERGVQLTGRVEGDISLHAKFTITNENRVNEETQQTDTGIVQPLSPGTSILSQQGKIHSTLEALIDIGNDLKVLDTMLQNAGGDLQRLIPDLTRWRTLVATRGEKNPFARQISTTDQLRLAYLPQRFNLGLDYLKTPLNELLTWLITSRETTNFTYDLTEINKEHLAWFISVATGLKKRTIRGYMRELEQDQDLKGHVQSLTRVSPESAISDDTARFGRRLGWYALVRALKPRIVMETGVDKGIGTCVLAAALMKNTTEGHPGMVYGLDINPHAGFLFKEPYSHYGRILYGNSLATLQAFYETIDIFIHDSNHDPVYERSEYEAVRDKLSKQAFLISDNAHVTLELEIFAERTGRQYLYFQEKPQAHFYPGAGIGLAFYSPEGIKLRGTNGEEDSHNTCLQNTRKNIHSGIGKAQIKLTDRTDNHSLRPNQIDQIPVILITYNRPEHTAKVLKALKKHGRTNLFIFADGPKKGADISKIEATRALFKTINWCEPKIFERTENIGLAHSIIAAVNHVFQYHDRLILLEDDCVPQEFFFNFIETCLDIYADNDKVFGISGYTVPIPDEILARYPYDLYFFPRIGSWGWATWKRAWQHFEPDLAKAYEKALASGTDLEQGGNDIPGMLYDMTHGKLKDVWTLNWVISVYLNNGCYIYPIRSHIENIGMDGTGVHCGMTSHFVTPLSQASPTRFPADVTVNKEINANFRRYYDHTPPKATRSTRPLKVVNLCMQDSGGAGKAAYRLHKGLQMAGVESTMVVLNKQSGDPSVKVLPHAFTGDVVSCVDVPAYTSPVWVRALRYWDKLMSEYPQRPTGLEMFTDATSEIVLDLVEEIRRADIVNLHWVAGQMDYSTAPIALGDKRIVWTMHDMNSFTGGCHYSGECSKYMTSCGACPQLGSEDADDLARRIWLMKQAAYKSLSIHVVTPSRWLADCVRKSSLMGSFPVKVIPNGFPLDIFKPYPKAEARRVFNIPESAKVVLFGADSITNERKGFKYIIEALNRYPGKGVSQEIALAFFGTMPEGTSIEAGCSVYPLGSIQDEKMLAMAYSAADCFLLPSLEDNLPNTVVEAMACGVPSIGFDLGGIPDMIEHKVTGYLVKPKDVEGLREGLAWVLSPEAEKANLSRNCREKAEREYGLTVQAKAYVRVYAKLLREEFPAHAHAEEINRLGESLFDRGNQAGALRAFQKAVSLDSSLVDAYNNLAVLAWSINDAGNAVRFLKQALAIDRDNRDALRNLCDIYISQGKQSEARALYASYMDRHPGDDEIRGILGSIEDAASVEASNRNPDSGQASLPSATNFSDFTYSKKSHFLIFDAFCQRLFGRKIDPNDSDVKAYQDFLAYSFIEQTIPRGSRILEIGGGDSRVLRAISEDYECWNIDKLEGIGNGPISVSSQGYRLVRDYMGNFSRELPDSYFDFVFSISVLEHVQESEETYLSLCRDIDRVLKPGGMSLHLFDIVIKKESVWSNGLLPYMFDRYETVNCFVPFESLRDNPELYTMNEAAYARLWQPVTGQSFEEFGRPASYNILWRKAHDSTIGTDSSGKGALETAGFPSVENSRALIRRLKKDKAFLASLPKISIVTPSYNQGEYLEECITSIVGQGYPYLEYIIMDGGSTDDSVEIIRKYDAHLAYWQSKPDAGQYAAIKEGLDKSRGEIMGWLNSDDKLHEDSLFIIALIFTHHRHINWIMGRPTVWDGHGRLTTILDPIPRWSRKDYLSRHYGPPHIQQESTFWRRSLWEKAGVCIDTSLKYAGDLELWSRFFRSDDLYSVDALLGGFRSHAGQKTTIMTGYDQEANKVLDREIALYNKDRTPLRTAPRPIVFPDPESRDTTMVQGEKPGKHGRPYDADIIIHQAELFLSLGDKSMARALYLSYLIKHPLDGIVTAAWEKLKDRDEGKAIVDMVQSEKKNYLVSAIVSTYKSEEFIEECLRNLLSQSIASDIEIIVVDAASPQAEGEVVKKYQQVHKNITYIRTKDRIGIYPAWNIAIKNATGKFCISVSTNDVLCRDACDILAKALCDNPHCIMVYGNTYLTHHPHETFDKNSHYGTYEWPEYSFERLMEECMVGPHPMWRRSVHEHIGYFDERFVADGDQEFWLRMGERYSLLHLNEFTGLQWITTDALSQQGNIPLLEAHFIHSYYQARNKHCLKELAIKCSMIIPVFNRVELTKQCLHAIVENTPQNIYEIIIVDNASTDETAAYLASLNDASIRIIRNEKNLGFAKACNQGAQSAHFDYLLFLNNDTEPQPGWLEPLLAILDNDHTVAAAGSKLIFPDGTIQHAGVVIIEDRKLPDPLVARHIYYQQASDLPEANQLRTYQALTAACILIRRDSYKKVDGFDEGYWNGYEDVDLCFKLQENGLKLVYQPESIVVHHESKSGPERFNKVDHNIDRLHDRWIGKIKPDVIINEDGSTKATDAHRIQPYVLSMDIKSRMESVTSKKQPNLVSIVILTFNQLEYTKKCIESLKKYTPEPHEIIFVDNGSTDGTKAYLQSFAESHEHTQLILNEKNLGFAAGNNQAYQKAKGNYILLLNNDIVVTDKWLGRMIGHLEQSPDIGMVGPMSNSVSGPQQVEMAPYGNKMKAMHAFAKKYTSSYFGKTSDIVRLVGFCLLIKRQVLDIIGCLDDNYGNGNYEDDDICLRSHIAGFRNIIAHDVFIHHYGSMTFKGNAINYHATMNDNRQYFSDKWKDLIEISENGYRLHMTREQQVKKLLEWGEARFSEGDVSASIKIFKRILLLDTTNSEALNNLGVIQWQLSDPVSAIKTFQIALNFNPKDPDGLANLLQAATETGKFDLINPDLLDILKQAQPENPDVAKLTAALQATYKNSEGPVTGALNR